MAIPPVADVLELDVEERLELIQTIWDKVAETPESLPVTESERAELARRRADYEANPETSIPWAEARARLRRQR